MCLINLLIHLSVSLLYLLINGDNEHDNHMIVALDIVKQGMFDWPGSGR